MRPRARRTDPATSHEAAASVQRVTKKQADVLACFRKFGRMTDSDLLRMYEGDPQSPSGLRTRRRELTDKGMLRAVGKTTNESGRTVLVWAVTDDIATFDAQGSFL